MNKNTGIVLKNHTPRKQKISLFDREWGRVEATIASRSPATIARLSAGALLEYTLCQVNGHYKLESVYITKMPFALARCDIIFLHQLLELCYYSLPEGEPAPELFEYLGVITSCQLAHAQAAVKKVFLLKVCALLGIYPEQETRSYVTVQRLISQSLETILTVMPDDAQLAQLDHMLLQCMASHPYKKHFKTLYFAMQSGAL